VGGKNKKKVQNTLQHKDLTTEIQRTWNVKKTKNKSGTSKNKDNWKYPKIIQNIPEQHTGKTRNQGTTDNNRIWHCTHTEHSTWEIT